MAETPGNPQAETKPVTPQPVAADASAKPAAGTAAAIDDEPDIALAIGQNALPSQAAGAGPSGTNFAVSVTGGAVAGALAHGMVVNRHLNKNLANPYIQSTKESIDKEIAKAGSASALFKGDAKQIQQQATDLIKKARRDACDDLKEKGSPQTQALLDENTTLGSAARNARDKYANPHTAFRQAMDGKKTTATEEYGRKAEAIVAAGEDAAKRESAARELITTMLKESNDIDRMHVAEKVRNVSWLKKINPFAGDMHIAGGQKAVAILAGTATLVIGAFGLSKLGQMIASKENGSVQK